jgi:hypothetical protein
MVIAKAVKLSKKASQSIIGGLEDHWAARGAISSEILMGLPWMDVRSSSSIHPSQAGPVKGRYYLAGQARHGEGIHPPAQIKFF